jgi:Fic family protein
MRWNWQQPGWPHFTWENSALESAERQFLLSAGALIGIVKHLPGEDREQITIESLGTEAITTSQIEGEMLDRASVQSSIRRQFGLHAETRRVLPAEQGIAEIMVDLYRSYSEPLSHEMLFAWHAKLASGRRDLQDIGRYRTSREPMQIVSGPDYKHTIHFEAPPSSRIKPEMRRFIAWFNRTSFNRTGPGASSPLPALTRAGIAHLYFESIHPFEDGNGRIGRALAQKSLAQSLGQPSLIALAATILARRKNYYDALELAARRIEATAWLNWFADTVLEAQSRTSLLIEFLIDKTKLLDRLRGALNGRQEKALLRMLREGPDGFEGGLSAGNYAVITGASPATTTRDLVELANLGALIRSGEGKYTRYRLALPLRENEAAFDFARES